MVLRFFVKNLDECFIDLMLRMCFLAKIKTKFFLDRLTRRNNTVLFKWCFFNSARYVKDFYYVVVNFLRESGAEKNIFEIIWKTRFLFVRDAVENLNNAMIRSNDVNIDEVIFCMIEVILVAEDLIDCITICCLSKTCGGSTYEDAPRGWRMSLL